MALMNILFLEIFDFAPSMNDRTSALDSLPSWIDDTATLCPDAANNTFCRAKC